jgi:hypothetical protein
VGSLVEVTIGFRDVPESVIGDLDFTTHLDPWPLLFLIYARIEESPDLFIRIRSLRLFSSVDQFHEEYPLHTYLLDDYVGWLAEELQRLRNEAQEDQ